MSGLIDKILLPLDGSEIANQALPIAQQLAQQVGAELILMRVVAEERYEVKYRQTMPIYQLNAENQQLLVDHAMRWLERLADSLALHKIVARAVVDIGDPGEKILSYAAEDDVDLIVMSTHGRKGVPRLLHGSVTAKVLADAPCPVVLVRPQIAAEPPVANEEMSTPS
jgi:nucleotide-binding universal stress UspA family protein